MLKNLTAELENSAMKRKFQIGLIHFDAIRVNEVDKNAEMCEKDGCHAPRISLTNMHSISTWLATTKPRGLRTELGLPGLSRPVALV